MDASRALLTAAVSGLLCAAAVGCGSGDARQPEGVITSSTVVKDMTLEKFTAECATRGGKVEVHSHCGGMNSCRGMSYDAGTQTLTEHTCRYTNSCAGYSCVLPM